MVNQEIPLDGRTDEQKDAFLIERRTEKKEAMVNEEIPLNGRTDKDTDGQTDRRTHFS